MSNSILDVIIIGAGPSGCVAGAYLNNRGLNIKMIEKQKFPRFVIGESLLPRCMEHFEETGLLDCLEKKKFEIKRGVIMKKNDRTCEIDFGENFTEGWKWTWQVPRADFDKALSDELEAKGVDILFETEVVGIEEIEDWFEIRIKDKKGTETTIRSSYLIDCSGYGRVIPRLFDLDKPTNLPRHGSMFTHIMDSQRPEGKSGASFAFDVIEKETWFWVIPFSNGTTSIGFVGPLEFFDAIEGEPEEAFRKMLELSPNYKNRFKNQSFLFKPHQIKNYSKGVKKLYGRRYAITGNSAEFIDPVFSSGVTMATESALLAAKLINKEVQHGEKVNWEKEYSSHIKAGSAVFESFVREWYSGNLQKLFFDTKVHEESKRQITSVLAGYVWDKENPFVRKHHYIIKQLAKISSSEIKPEVISSEND